MLYRMIIRRQAKKKLQALPSPIRTRIAEQLYVLAHNPDNRQLDVKKLEGQYLFRLRVGQWRIIFERDDIVKVISIERIGSRGDAYK